MWVTDDCLVRVDDGEMHSVVLVHLYHDLVHDSCFVGNLDVYSLDQLNCGIKSDLEMELINCVKFHASLYGVTVSR